MADLIDRAAVLAIFDKLDDGSRAAEQARQAIASLPARVVGMKRYDLQQPESHISSAYMQEDDYGDWVRYEDAIAALPAQGVRVKPEAARRVQAMLDSDPASKLFGVSADDLRAILAALAPAEAGRVEAKPTAGQRLINAAQEALDKAQSPAPVDALVKAGCNLRAAREAALREAVKRVSELLAPESPQNRDYNTGVGVSIDAILALIPKDGGKP